MQFLCSNAAHRTSPSYCTSYSDPGPRREGAIWWSMQPEHDQSVGGPSVEVEAMWRAEDVLDHADHGLADLEI